MRVQRIIGCLFVLGFSGRAECLELNASATYGGEYTSNVGNTFEDDESDQWIHRPGLAVTASEDIASVELDLSYRADRRIYADNAFEDETEATGEGHLRWSPIVDRWEIFASNRRSYDAIDPTETDDPRNRQTTDYTNVGTDLMLPLVGNQYLNLGATYGQTNADESDTDSERYGGSASYGIDLSASRRLSISGTYTDVDFDDVFSVDYNAMTGSLQFSSASRVLQLHLSAGYREIDRDNFDEKVDGVVGGIDVTWALSESTSIFASVSQDLTDNFNPSGSPRAITGFEGDELRDLSDEAESILAQQRTDSTEIYESRAVSLGYTTTFGRYSVDLRTSYSSREYETAALSDEDGISASGNISRRLSDKSSITLNAFHDEFGFGARDDKLTRFGIVYEIAPWPRLSFGLGGSYEKRTSDEDLVDYETWEGHVSMRYTFINIVR